MFAGPEHEVDERRAGQQGRARDDVFGEPRLRGGGELPRQHDAVAVREFHGVPQQRVVDPAVTVGAGVPGCSQ
nr:hypothetical protein [Kitasatospora fiedleri]